VRNYGVNLDMFINLLKTTTYSETTNFEFFIKKNWAQQIYQHNFR